MRIETKYICSVCGEAFPDEKSASDHENKHKAEEVFKATVPSKFNIGDVIKYVDMDGGTLYVISTKKVGFVNDKPIWMYGVDTDSYLKNIYKYECDIELVMTEKQMRSLIASFNKKLKDYKCDLSAFCDLYIDMFAGME